MFTFGVVVFIDVRGFMTSHGIPDGSRSARYILKDYVKVNNLIVSFASQDLYASSAYKSMHLLFIRDFFSHWHTFKVLSHPQDSDRNTVFMFLQGKLLYCIAPPGEDEKQFEQMGYKVQKLIDAEGKETNKKDKVHRQVTHSIQHCWLRRHQQNLYYFSPRWKNSSDQKSSFLFSYWNYFNLTMKKRLLSHLLQ